jgi:hypothetical protein
MEARRERMPKRKSSVLLVLLVTLALSAAGASAASATPGWEFNGTPLTGTETVLGVSSSSSMAVPGVMVTCGHALLFMKISNTSLVGPGDVTKFLQYECTTNDPSCAVSSIDAERLPWSLRLVTVAAKNYVVIEGIDIGVEFSGERCAFAGTPIVITGTAGGLFENSTSTLTFNKASFEATSTSLKVGSSAITWTALFALEALGVHSGEALELG